jgi:hypothetical protein
MPIRSYHSIQNVHMTISEKIAFFVTINKAQGQMLKRVEMSLGETFLLCLVKNIFANCVAHDACLDI